MSDEQKNTKEETLNCCEGMPFAEMMSQMTTMFCQQQGEKEETRKEGKETKTANQYDFN